MKRTRSGKPRKKAVATDAARIRAQATRATFGFPGTSAINRMAATGQIEKKVIDVSGNDLSLNTTGEIIPLNGVAQGDNFNNRQGRKITMKSVFIRGYATYNAVATDNFLARIILFLDKQANSNSDTITQYGPALLTTLSPVAQLNMANAGRFQILKEWQFPMGKQQDTATQAFAVGPGIKSIKKWLSLRDLPVSYSGTSAAQGSILNNALFLLGVSDSATGAIFKFTSRVRFTDV